MKEERSQEKRLQNHSAKEDAQIVSIAKPTGFGLDVVPTILRRVWWIKALSFIWLFRKQSFKPALLMVIGCVIYFSSLFYFRLIFGSQTTINGMGEAIFKLGSCFIVLLGGAVGAFVFFTWSLGLWLAVLTGFSRAFLLYETDIGKESLTMAEFQESCVAYFKTRKSFLVTTWLVFSAISLIPFIWLLVITAVVYTSLPGAGVGFLFSREQVVFAVITGLIVLLFISNYTLMVFPVSSLSSKPARQVAIDSLVLSLRLFPVLSAVSFFSMVLNHLVGAPIALILEQPILSLLLLALSILSTVIIVPLSLIVPCELIRNSIVLEKTPS